MNAWIDELERDLGMPARLRVVANTSGQSREIPHPAYARKSALAAEIGAEAVVWLADRFAGLRIDFPSARGGEVQRRASLLRAAILDAGLTNPTRTANDVAREHGVTAMWVKKLRAQMRADMEADQQLWLPGI
ncbi:hypothetical protein M3484_04940 [Pseudomonas sp. GX19020]|uniref:hypothetical protein n=1 Tax=Pseudomonas sp. GX19020 TaxID=2942277 RepID=UPI002018E391|nr:hypothetical protein [Pseudomonas sp. GX19020]MCL4065907.1 hypothetical protein [Pseudomonas sp. GX19020]